MTDTTSDGAALSAPHRITYTYTRSTGPVLGAFLTALRERRLVGVRTADGRVLVPPAEYDPVTSAELSELVDVADTGTVTCWAWNDTPLAGQPLDHPFAWALVRLVCRKPRLGGEIQTAPP